MDDMCDDGDDDDEKAKEKKPGTIESTLWQTPHQARYSQRSAQLSK